MILKPPKGAMVNRGHPLSRGLNGCWIFNEGGGIIVNDSTGNGNTGIFGAGAASPTWPAGKFGSALSFDGGDYVDCGKKDSLFIRNAITISAWIKANDWTPAATGMVVAKSGPEKDHYLFYPRATTNDFRFLIYRPTGTTNYATYDVSGFDVDKWYHFVGTYDKIFIRLYVDGIEKATPVAETTVIGNTTVVETYIGSRKYEDLFIDGHIDHVMIYNRALSASEIAYLYRNPFCMFEVDL